MKQQSMGKMSITRRNNIHKEFVAKDKEREKLQYPQGSKKINGRIYTPYEKTYEIRNEAVQTEKELKNTNMTHIEKINGKWTIFLFPI
jgi:hypothetical protein